MQKSKHAQQMGVASGRVPKRNRSTSTVPDDRARAYASNGGQKIGLDSCAILSELEDRFTHHRNRGCMGRMESDAKLVRDIIDQWETAVQNHDMEGTLANHSPDILMFDVPEPIQARGLAEYQETWELFFKNNPGGIESFHLRELEVVVDESLAVAHALLDAGDDKCRLTTVLRKIDGQWMIVHEHHSSPWPDPREAS
jgi:ketosteroid isomerase-like protein